MKSIWCDTLNGSWPPWQKCRDLGVTRIYVDAREVNPVNSVLPLIPGTSRLAVLVDGIHSQGFESGIFRDPVWGGWTTPAEYAQLASKDITVAEQGKPKQIAYMHDLETHDIQWILAALKAWRKPRPSRMTDVTWEPMQGGLWSQQDADALCVLLNAGGPGGVYHQNYFGGMKAANAERCRADLVVRGFPDSRLFGFYDGLDLPAAWDGCIFTTGRLP